MQFKVDSLKYKQFSTLFQLYVIYNNFREIYNEIKIYIFLIYLYIHIVLRRVYIHAGIHKQ